jgi:hypothetical protein
MDKLTDLLSTFFVASQNTKQKNKKPSLHHKNSLPHSKQSDSHSNKQQSNSYSDKKESESHSNKKQSHSYSDKSSSSHSDKKQSHSHSDKKQSYSHSDKKQSESHSDKSSSSHSDKKQSHSHSDKKQSHSHSDKSSSSHSDKKQSGSHSDKSSSSHSDKKQSGSHSNSSLDHKSSHSDKHSSLNNESLQSLKNISDKIKSNTSTSISTDSVNLESKSKKESKKSETNVDIYSDLTSNTYEEKNNIFENNNIVKEYYKGSLKENVQKIFENDKKYKKINENVKKDEEIKERVGEEIKKNNHSENEKNLKKYVLKPSEFYKKNIFIVSDDIKIGTDILSDLLHKISLINNLEKIYDNQINIISNIENKKIYKQMLLENPYLYFTDLNVKNTLHKNRIDTIDENARTIFIFDDEMALQYIDYVEALIQKNVHLFILSNEDYKNGNKLYNTLGSSKLLIYKPSKSKLVQKRFYKNFIHPFYKEWNFDQYFNKINNENIDTKYIILKDTELRYN